MSLSLNKILYVEDEPDIQAIVKISLENLGGFQVKVCNNGLEAVQEAPVFAPDLILLDVMMPDMDGPTTLKELRKIPETVNVPVIFMTAKAQLHEVEMYKGQGVLEVITKPFDPMTLPETIKKIWETQNV